MGFRFRKSLQIVPGVRLNFSKTGIGYSVGVPGYRVTRRADGKTMRTMSLPGTGISHVEYGAGDSNGQRARSASPAPTAPVASAPEPPGFFAPKDEKALYNAVRQSDVDAFERIAQESPEYALAAATLAAIVKLGSKEDARARELMQWIISTNRDPAQDPFIEKYVHGYFELPIADGVTAQLGVNRDAIGLALAELHQRAGDFTAAIDTVEQLEPTSYSAVSLAELYANTGRWADVVDLTNGVTNADDSTAMLCVFRGIAFREQRYFDAARESFKEALRIRKRSPEIRHRALMERARSFEAEGKRALARKDLERILAADAVYPGVAEALAALTTGRPASGLGR